MEISLIYMPPFLTVECTRETAMAELSVSLVQLAMKLSSAGQRIMKSLMKEQSVCGQKTRCSIRTTTSYSYEPAVT